MSKAESEGVESEISGAIFAAAIRKKVCKVQLAAIDDIREIVDRRGMCIARGNYCIDKFLVHRTELGQSFVA